MKLSVQNVIEHNCREAYRTTDNNLFRYRTRNKSDVELGILPNQREDEPEPSSGLPGDKAAESGLPGPSEGDNTKGRLPQPPGDVREKEVGRELPQNHNPGRDRIIPRFEFNTPDSDPDSRYRTKTKTPIRSPGVRQQGEHPYKNDYRYVTRRVMAMLEKNSESLFPTRQKEQHGYAKKYSRRWYRKRRRKHTLKQKKRYRLIKRRGMFRRRESMRDQFPRRFKRKPSGGYRAPKERTKDWRGKEKLRALNKYASDDPLHFFYGPELQDAWFIDFNKKDKTVQFVVAIPNDYLESELSPDDFLNMAIFAEEDEFEWFVDELTEEFGEEVFEVDPDELEDPFVKTALAEGLTFHYDNRAPEKRTKTKDQRDQEEDGSLPKGENTFNTYPDAPGHWPPNQTHAPYKQDRNERTPSTKFDHGRPVLNAPGNSKVIQWDADVSHHKDFSIKADTQKVLRRWTERSVKDKGKAYRPVIIKHDKYRNRWWFKVGDWVVKVKANPHPGSKRQNVQGMDLRVSCNCPFWQWQGPAHWATLNGYQYGRTPGTATVPKIRDPKHKHAVCKHAISVFDFISSTKLKIHKIAHLDPEKVLAKYTERTK